MSIFLDISNIKSNVDKQKYEYFNEFGRLMEVNKEFLSNTSSNSDPVENTTRIFCKPEHFEDNTIKNNQHNFLNHVENTNLPGKSAKIGNFNLYNRCVFFINNSSNNGYLDQFKNNSPLDNEKNQNERFCGNLAKTAVHNPQSKSTKQSKPFKRQQFSDSHCKSSVYNEKQDHTPRQNDKLFYLHKTTLRPVLSTNIKSGVYKRILQPETVSKEPVRNKCNVYFSPGEKNGRILTAVQFNQTYIKNESQCNSRNVELQSNDSCINSVPNLASDLIFPQENSNEYRISEDSLNFFPCEFLNLPESISSAMKRTSNETIDNERGSQKEIIYKVIHPSLLGLETSNDVSGDFISANSRSQNKLTEKSLVSKSTNRSQTKKIIKQNPEVNDVQQSNPMLPSTTRYGRVSKPPQYIQKTFKITTNEETEKQSIFERDNDKDFKYTREILPSATEVPDLIIKRDRNLSPNSQCNYCNKIYLGRRMLRHLEANPEHNTALHSKEDELYSKLSLYKFLVKKIKQSPEENRAEIFLSEISDLVDQLQSRSSRFVRNTSGVHFVNLQSSKVLGIPEGHYSIDVSGIDSAPETEHMTNEHRMIIPPPPPRLDYNLSISLDDTISDTKLNLPDNMVSSEESLLRTVNDLVDQSISDLRGHDDVINCVQTPVINYDHASDNAVEAVTIKTEQAPPILDLSLDLFQFSSN